jgi:hypothetical protein
MRAMLLVLLAVSLLAITSASGRETSGEGSGRSALANSAPAPISARRATPTLEGADPQEVLLEIRSALI